MSEYIFSEDFNKIEYWVERKKKCQEQQKQFKDRIQEWEVSGKFEKHPTAREYLEFCLQSAVEVEETADKMIASLSANSSQKEN